MLENLVKRIIELLEIRETTVISITHKEINANNDHLFIKAKTVRIKDVDRTFLDMLLSGEVTEKLAWLDRARSYGVDVELELFDSGAAWLCYDQIAKIDYPIFSANQKRLVHIPYNVICFRDVALLELGSTLCKYKKQLVTLLAYEELEKKQIDIIERV